MSIVNACIQCKPKALDELTGSVGCTADRLHKLLNVSKPFIIPPCYHCWFTDTFKNPILAFFTIMITLMSMGMIKMLCCECCCKTKDGRFIDVASILLGTTSDDHTWRLVYMCIQLHN